MINNFNNQDKYLVIVPLLSEVDRIVEGSMEVEFVQPHANDNNSGTKYASLEEHLILGRNIVSTHKMYESLAPLAKAGLLSDYHIIIDEVPDVVKPIAMKSKTSIDEFYIDTGFMEVDEGSGRVMPKQKWIDTRDQVFDTLSPKILSAAMSGCLYLQDRQMFIWALPPILLQAGLSLTVLTYKAEGLCLRLPQKTWTVFPWRPIHRWIISSGKRLLSWLLLKTSALKNEKFSHNASKRGLNQSTLLQKKSQAH